LAGSPCEAVRQARHVIVGSVDRQGDGESGWSAPAGTGTACFDLRVEHGIAAARAHQLPGASKTARAIEEPCLFTWSSGRAMIDGRLCT